MAARGDLDGRTFVVTGANTGIGRATAHDLARRGGRVVLACRSAARTRPVLAALREATGNEDLSFLPLDLSDLRSVRRAAAELFHRGAAIDVLIANAGVAGQRGATAQGFELAFGVNHLGHFLFVTALADLLRRPSPRRRGPARVVVVSSDAHYQASGLDVAALRRPTRTFTGMQEYRRSKLANVLFVREFARRFPAEEVTAYAVHPGVIASDIWRRIPWPLRPLVTGRMGSPDEGARTPVWCATDEELAGESGGYYADGVAKQPSAVATPELAAWLWSRSEEWTEPR